ncbi:secA_DEAD domain-containing protein [Trichonephila clavipes]|nr:secA_DEAD domain-containing protein [Trichonephila clavipes]
MHSNSQNLNCEDNYISDEEFHDAEENDLSDLESIPSPSSFQIRNLSSSVSLNQSKFDYFGNIYRGSIKGGKLSGFGKLSSQGEKEYIEGTWRNSQLVEIFLCQFVHFTRSVSSRKKMRIYGKDNLFTFDRGDFIAKIKVGKLEELNFARPFNPLSSGKGFLEKITITQVLEDKLLNKRDLALERFSQNASSANAEDLLQLYNILEEYQWRKFQSTLNLNEDILDKIIKNTYVSEEFRNSAKQLLDAEQLLSERNEGFPNFAPSIQPNLLNLLGKLRAICKEGISNHKRLLLRKCPHYSRNPSGLMTQSIFRLRNQKILYLSDKDVQLFSDLTTFADQPEHLEQLWCTLFSKVEGTNSKSIKDISPLTNPIYPHLFKSLQELITEISNTAEIPKEDLLKVDSTGNWNLLEEGSIKWDKSSHTTCSIEQQYRFIFKLIEHFKPGCYSHKNKFKYEFRLLNAAPEKSLGKAWQWIKSFFVDNKLPDIPEERLVWLYILDDAMESIRKHQETQHKSSEQSKKDFRELLSCFLASYIKFITEVKDDRYELFRIAAHNMIKLAAQVSPIYCAIGSESKDDKKILTKQLELINEIFTSESNELSFDNFTNLIEVYNEYWEHRQYIESIPEKFPFDPFKRRMENISSGLPKIVGVSLNKRVTTQVLINYLRSFNEFLKHFKCVDFKWFIKSPADELITQEIVRMVNEKQKSYEVLKPQEFINHISKSYEGNFHLYITSAYEHYVIKVVGNLLNIIERSLTRRGWNNKVCLNITSELLLAIGHSLIHLKEQPNYVDFKQFLIDSTKPFENAVKDSPTYEDFKKRISSIENFYLYAKKQNEISIEKALDLYKDEVEKLRESGFNPDYNSGILKSCYEKYLTEFQNYITDKKDIQYIIDNMKGIISNVEGQLRDNKWTQEFKQNTIPLLLAGLAAIWSKLESKDIECTTEILKPHCIQILCILKLLSVDVQHENIDSQFAQVLTGQGKSIILGLLSPLLALMEYKVRIVCYSEYLACRDEKSFESFFEKLKDFGVGSKISYGTFEDMANDTIYVDISGRKVGLRTLVEELIRGNLEKQTQESKTKKDKAVLLVDEADVFFSDKFYGNTYNPGTTIGMPEIAEIQSKIWSIVSGGVHIKDSILNDMENFVNTFRVDNTEFSQLLSISFPFFTWHLEKMIDNAVNVVQGDEKNWYINKYKINDDGVISCRKGNGLYSTNTFYNYYNVFNYFRLKKADYDHKSYNNYGYILVDCGKISYAELPKEYPIILGVSGTLTKLYDHEKKAVKSYGINRIASMPSFFGNSKLKENQHFAIKESEEDWLKNISDHMDSKVRSGRAVLIFFDTENEINKFEQKYKHNIGHLNMLTGNEKESQLEWHINEAGVAGTVTLATRNMGRGVDFKSNDSSVEHSGGVHVIQTFFSLDEKEETQIKGRTARKDNEGSYELILCMEHLKEIGCANKSDGNPVSNYKDLSDVRKIKAEEKGKDTDDKIKEAKEKHDKTMKFLKSFDNYTPDQRSRYFLEYPLIEQVSKKQHGLTHYKLFYDNKIDLESVRVCLKKCLEEIEKTDKGNSEIDSLKGDAENFLKVVDEIYEKQAKKFTEKNPLRNVRQCIILGRIEDCETFLEQVNGCNKEKRLLEQQIQNIQLLRAINTIEDALTVPEIKSTVVTAEYSDCLSRAYRLSRSISLSERYERTATHLYDKPLESKKDSNASQQGDWKQILEEGIKEYQSDVETIISAIKSTMTLSPTDCDKIKENYIERCLELSLEEMAECVENLATNRSGDFCKILEKLNDIKSLNEIPRPFNELRYYQLLKDHNISREKEGIFVDKFKIKCKEKTRSYVELGREELPLLKAFINFLTTKNLNLVQGQLRSFCNGDLAVTELLEIIMNLKVSIYGEELKVLQEKITRLKKEGLTDETIDRIKKVIEMYTRPVKMELKKVNNRLTMEVTGKNLVISEILIELNSKLLNNPEIEEVSFKGANIIHIDANIENDIWHGKNISIHAEKIKIYGKIIWDVSGKDGEDYTNNAGTDEKGEGKQGADGHPGESGGNVWILAEEMENSEKFTVISHGGKGGRGQDGGNGKNGKDGEGITKQDFSDQFPPVANFLSLPLSFKKDGEEKKGITEGLTLPESYRRTNIRTTVKNIAKEAREIKTICYSNMESTATNEDVIKKIIEDVSNIRILSEDSRNKGVPVFTGNIFVKAITDQGNKITFYFENGIIGCQAFLLYKGSDGEKGGKGGECGFGGPGGYGGEIIIKRNPKVFKIAREGDNGKDGDPGSEGKPGEDGWDMGYMDCSIPTPTVTFSSVIPIVKFKVWPEIKGENQNNKIELKSYDSSASDRIHCPYLRFLRKDGEFVRLEYPEIDHSKKEEREVKTSTKQNSERKCQTRAVRKKAIVQNEEEYYSLLEESMSVKDLESHFEKISNLKIEIQTREQQKTLVAEVERSVDFASGGEHHTSKVIANEQRGDCSVDQLKGNLVVERKLRRREKIGEQHNQAKTKKDSSSVSNINDCSKLVKALEEGDKACGKVLVEDKSKSILESVSVEQVADKSAAKVLYNTAG